MSFGFGASFGEFLTSNIDPILRKVPNYCPTQVDS